MEKIEIDGHVFTKSDIESMWTEMVYWRDESMKQWPDAIPFTVSATAVIGLLYGVIKQYPGEEA